MVCYDLRLRHLIHIMNRETEALQILFHLVELGLRVNFNDQGHAEMLKHLLNFLVVFVNQIMR